MVAIDAATAATAHATTIAVPSLPSAGGDFVAAAAADYRAHVDRSAPAISAAQVMECAAAWQFTLRDKTAEALDQLEATWRHQLVEFSPYNASSADEAMAQLEPAKRCVSLAWQNYAKLVERPGAKPGKVDHQALAFIAQLFEQGECEPASYRNSSSGVHQRTGALGRWPEAG